MADYWKRIACMLSKSLWTQYKKLKEYMGISQELLKECMKDDYTSYSVPIWSRSATGRYGSKIGS